MSLFFDLRVTDGPTPSSLGLLEVQRTSHTTERDPGPDVWLTYTVRLDGRTVGEVQHRYRDGPWALAGKAATAAWAQRAMDETDGPNDRLHAAQYVEAMGRVDGQRIMQRAIESAKADLDVES